MLTKHMYYCFLLFVAVLVAGSTEEMAPEDEDTPDCQGPVSYAGYQLLTLSPEGKKQRKTVVRLSGKQGVQFWLAQRNLTTGNFFAQILLSPDAIPRVIRKLKAKGVNFKVAINDLEKVIEEQSASSRDAAAYINREGHPLTWIKYHRLQDINDYWKYLYYVYPDVASVISAGHSYEGRELSVLRLGTTNKHLNPKPIIWIDGGVHAREWISPAVVTYLARELVKERELLQHVNFYLLPVLNPDGYEYSHTRDRLWRKTRSPQRPANATANQIACWGVDANRNWDSHWGERAGNRVDPCSHNYPGPKAFSEPETKAISDLLLRLRPAVYLTLHSYSQLWLMPWGHTGEPPEENARLRRVALKALEAIQDAGGSQYLSGSIHNTLYPISGSSMDWAHEHAKVRLAYLVELRDTGEHGFVLPPQEIEPTGREMLAAVKTLAEELIAEEKNEHMIH